MMAMARYIVVLGEHEHASSHLFVGQCCACSSTRNTQPKVERKRRVGVIRVRQLLGTDVMCYVRCLTKFHVVKVVLCIHEEEHSQQTSFNYV